MASGVERAGLQGEHGFNIPARGDNMRRRGGKAPSLRVYTFLSYADSISVASSRRKVWSVALNPSLTLSKLALRAKHLGNRVRPMFIVSDALSSLGLQRIGFRVSE